MTGEGEIGIGCLSRTLQITLDRPLYRTFQQRYHSRPRLKFLHQRFIRKFVPTKVSSYQNGAAALTIPSPIPIIRMVGSLVHAVVLPWMGAITNDISGTSTIHVAVFFDNDQFKPRSPVGTS